MMDGSDEVDPYFLEAKILVDVIIEKALASLGDVPPVTTIPGFESNDPNYAMGLGSALRNMPREPIPSIDWPSNDEFNIDMGLDKIEEYVQTWEIDPSWLHCIDFMEKQEQEYDTRYHYRVRYSVPTRRKPIPRVTACVYFTCSVSKVKPKEFPIDVYFVLRGNRLVHRPGYSRFREQWLKDIIINQSNLIDMIDF